MALVASRAPMASRASASKRSAHAVISKQLAITGAQPVPSAAELSREWATKTLTSADPQVVCNALSLLGQAGESVVWQLDCVDQIVNLLSHADPLVSARAADAVGKLAPLALSHLDRVLDLLSSSEGQQQEAAGLVLAKLGSAASSCSSQLASAAAGGKSLKARIAATTALGSVGSSSDESVLVKLLADESAEVVGAACASIGQLGLSGQGSAIASKLSSPGAKLGALQGLAALGELAPASASEGLIAALGDSNVAIRRAAVDAIGSGVPVAADQLAAALSSAPSSSASQRCALALALGALGPKGASAAKAVEELLGDDGEDSSAMSSVVAGGSMRPPPEMRKPRCAALLALAGMKLDKAMSAAAEALDMDDWEVRLTALEAMRMLVNIAQDEPSGHVTTLLESDSAFPVRAKAAEVIGAWRLFNFREALGDALADKAPSVRAAAAKAIGKMGSTQSQTAHEMFKLLQDSTPAVRAAALEGLSSLEDFAECYAGIIVTYLEDVDHSVRAAAIEAVGRLGDCGKDYIPELKERLADPSKSARVAAKAVLTAMGVEDVETVEPVAVAASKAPGAAEGQSRPVADGSVDLEFSNLGDFYRFSMEKLLEMDKEAS